MMDKNNWNKAERNIEVKKAIAANLDVKVDYKEVRRHAPGQSIVEKPKNTEVIPSQITITYKRQVETTNNKAIDATKAFGKKFGIDAVKIVSNKGSISPWTKMVGFFLDPVETGQGAAFDHRLTPKGKERIHNNVGEQMDKLFDGSNDQEQASDSNLQIERK